MSYSTQLTDVSNYNVNRMIFSQSQKNTIPNSVLTYQRININSRNEDGTVGDLILKTPMLFSFGVQESKSMETKEINGYVMPLCMWDRNNPSAEERAWTDMFDKICNHCKEYLVNNKNDIGKWDLEMNDLKKFNPLHWKRDKTTGRIEEGTGPTLYAKLISSKRDGVDKILSSFYDADTCEEINPLDILNKYCHVIAAIKIESIFIGTRIALQIKLWEVEVRLHGSGRKRLLMSNRDEFHNTNNNQETPRVSQNTRDSGSLNPSDDENENENGKEFLDSTLQPSPPKSLRSRRQRK